MRTLLNVMGVLETIVGLGLLGSPSFLAPLLLGSPLEGAVGLVVGRVCGAGLLSLGIACLLARGSDARAATGLITAMLVYNSVATALFVYCLLGPRLIGIALWPALVVHAALAIWCGMYLYSPKSNPT